MQKCRIHMIKQSFLEESSKESESYIADFIESNGKMYFQYDEIHHDATVSVEAGNDFVEIVRQGEATSRIPLRLRMKQEVTIDSPFGQMKMESYTTDIKKSSSLLVIDYQLLQENQVIGHFKITWQIMKEDMS